MPQDVVLGPVGRLETLLLKVAFVEQRFLMGFSIIAAAISRIRRAVSAIAKFLPFS